jgi:ribosomal protein S18 acetylase RimI-like enzyme
MANDEVFIREATPEDALDVSKVCQLGITELRRVYRPQFGLTKQSSRKPIKRLVALMDEKVVGTVQCQSIADRLHLIGLFVHPDYHRRGIARSLVEKSVMMARSEGINRLSLYTIEETGNVTIFERLDFTAVRRGVPFDMESVDGKPITEVYMERAI